MNRQIEVSKGRLRRLPVRNRNCKIAAHRDEDLHLASDHGLERSHDVMPVLAGRLEAEAALQPIQKLVGRYLRDPDRAVALHIGMAADGAKPCTLAPDMAAKQGEVGKLLDISRAVAVLCDAHAIDDDRALSLHVGLRGMLDVVAR